MEPTDLTHLTWHKSSHSGTQENCVEVARTPSFAAVRDSKDPNGTALRFAPHSFAVFLQDLQTRDEDTRT
ncbi:DUF397 domain-containing protein [Saccharopolyspora sp. NFXS83]|uniref:DUF397 domain-containing protein n=1 Tax=Saccharopolyspora sp. NFXS83 TaxID=2993560 RepID=UPI00224B128A|nr:DUF397 domain-containing protein [Saccharopolyspora sp. NFXS83]MCX2732645.1 DUF397 domain-containing protein [Saccharopolyspora sp. NFXS83]